MRRMANCHDSPALLHVRTPSVPRVDPSRLKKGVWRMGEVEAEAVVVLVVAAVGRSYREGARGKIRPDSSRHPMGRNLTLEKLIEKVIWNVISLAFFTPIFFCLTFSSLSPSPQFPNFCPTPTIVSKASGPRMGCSLVWQSCSGDIMECRQQQEDNICWKCWQKIELVCGPFCMDIIPRSTHFY